MFHQYIAIVVGAGASAEYGMPTGAALKNKVASGVRFASRRLEDQDLNAALSSLYANCRDAYKTAGEELAQHILSGVPSIDDALTWFSSRQEVVDIGKTVIAYEILKAERSSPLYSGTLELAPNKNFDDTWMPHFLSMVMSGHKNENAESAFEKVYIINFNYDRSIEHFLYSELQYRYGISDSRSKRIVTELNMFRPYGTIGNLPWQPGAGLAFGESPQPARLFEASTNIFTFSEGATEKVRSQIQAALARARVCIFIGFGFHTQNMNLLRSGSAEAWRRAYATVKGISPENHRDLAFGIAQIVGCLEPHMPKLLDWTAHKLLTDLRPALMAASAM